MKKQIKILIVDDSALVRKIFSDILTQDPRFEVLGVAQNGIIALRKIADLKPDVITLDIEMPELDGFGVLREMHKKNMEAKVLMVSAQTTEGAKTTFKALEMGAIDFISKPSGRLNDLQILSDTLKAKISTIAEIDFKKIVRKIKYEHVERKIPTKKIAFTTAIPKRFVVIGTSTGGPQALKEILENPNLPENCAYLMVQHMPAEFTPPFAERLNQVSKLRVKEAEHNESVLMGCGYLAPGHSHMEIEFKHNKPYIKLSQTDKVSGHRPSINVLFNSIASTCPKEAIAIIMTGMGKDGAVGIKSILDKGGQTISQDKESSVVFGMNKEAIDIGGIQKIVSLQDIPHTINSLF